MPPAAAGACNLSRLQLWGARRIVCGHSGLFDSAIVLMIQCCGQVRFYYSFTSKENLYIVMEYLNGGDCFSLLRMLGALEEDAARLYAAEAILALEYCHTQVETHLAPCHWQTVRKGLTHLA